MVPWESFGSSSLRPGAERKLLSEDLFSGASSNLIRYPAGWNLQSSQCLACDEELYVVEGALSIGSTRYGAGAYAYLPAGFKRDSMNSPQGATVVTFFEAALALSEGRLPTGDAVQYLQTADLPWASAGDSRIASGDVGLKVLRLAPNGDRTWLLSIAVADGKPFEINGIETHPCVEETFLLQGDMAMPMGQMGQGAYFWRPPNVPHGPMGTATGFLGLFRCKEGGAFATEWANSDAPIDWQAPYRPVLSTAMATVNLPRE
jgi:hypothetical protein